MVFEPQNLNPFLSGSQFCFGIGLTAHGMNVTSHDITTVRKHFEKRDPVVFTSFVEDFSWTRKVLGNGTVHKKEADFSRGHQMSC